MGPLLLSHLYESYEGQASVYHYTTCLSKLGYKCEQRVETIGPYFNAINYTNSHTVNQEYLLFFLRLICKHHNLEKFFACSPQKRTDSTCWHFQLFANLLVGQIIKVLHANNITIAF